MQTAARVVNIDIDIEGIEDTFGVSTSVSTIHLGWGIEVSINDSDVPDSGPEFRYSRLSHYN